MAPMTEILIPDLGGIAEAPVVEVLVQAGDTVKAGDPLLTLESEKAAVDIPAPSDGVIGELRVAVGDTVRKGTVVMTLGSEGGDEPPKVPDASPKKATSKATETTSTVAPTKAAPAPADAAPAPAAKTPPPTTAPQSGDPIYASPTVRRMAREQGLDLSGVSGSGRGGRIMPGDLVGAPASAASAGAGGVSPTTTKDRWEHQPFTRIQRASAKNLTTAWQTIPHVTQHEDADITGLEAFRKQMNAEQSKAKVTMVALLVKAAAGALDAFPRFASSLDGDDGIVLKPERHIGFAADTPNGLVVPVIRDASSKGILEIAADLMELSGKAREGNLGLGDMSGAVFTISSLGGIGGTGFTPIVNPPQVAILGAVRASMQPVWNGAEFEPRLMLPLSLSYDHRVIDGAAAARFCVHLKGLLEDMRRILL